MEKTIDFEPKFMRLSDNRIYTAIKTFVKDEVSVKFAANIHDGPRDYYDSILKSLEYCECVLYEKIGRNADEISDSLRPYKALFDVWNTLSFRPVPREDFISIRDGLNINKKGWIWCDVWFSELFEQFRKVFPSKHDIEQYIRRIFDRYLDEHYDIPADNKRFFELLATFFPEDAIGKILVHFRNVRLIECIKQSLSEGVQRLGILYGASHGDELEDLLLNEFDFSLKDEIWVLNRF